MADVYPESLGYRIKRLFLGKPFVTEQLSGERLNRAIALGVLAPDCISSSAYGTEEILTQMTPFIGIAAFALVVPIMFVIIGVLFFVTTSYMDVIKYYTTAGGSYVVARDNFGPKIAQIAAVALLDRLHRHGRGPVFGRHGGPGEHAAVAFARIPIRCSSPSASC